MVKKDLVNKYDLKDFQNFTLKKKINYFKFLERLMRNSKDTIFYQDNSLDKTEIKFFTVDILLNIFVFAFMVVFLSGTEPTRTMT